MLNENIKAIRKSKGLSQEEFAIKLNVVRQTVSKWENGLSVPDSDMLLTISEILETPVSILLGETIIETKADDIKDIAEKLKIINQQLAQRKAAKQKMLQVFFALVCVFIGIIFAVIIFLGSPYLSWDYSNPETAVIGVALHVFEWLFIRTAPFILLGAIIGIVAIKKKV